MEGCDTGTAAAAPPFRAAAANPEQETPAGTAAWSVMVKDVPSGRSRCSGTRALTVAAAHSSRPLASSYRSWGTGSGPVPVMGSTVCCRAPSGTCAGADVGCGAAGRGAAGRVAAGRVAAGLLSSNLVLWNVRIALLCWESLRSCGCERWRGGLEAADPSGDGVGSQPLVPLNSNMAVWTNASQREAPEVQSSA